MVELGNFINSFFPSKIPPADNSKFLAIGMSKIFAEPKAALLSSTKPWHDLLRLLGSGGENLMPHTPLEYFWAVSADCYLTPNISFPAANESIYPSIIFMPASTVVWAPETHLIYISHVTGIFYVAFGKEQAATSSKNPPQSEKKPDLVALIWWVLQPSSQRGFLRKVKSAQAIHNRLEEL